MKIPAPTRPEARPRAFYNSGASYSIHRIMGTAKAGGALRLALLLACAILCFARPARAQITYTFTGAGGDDNWGTTANWSPVPATYPDSSGDNVAIYSTVVNLNVTPVTIGSLTLAFAGSGVDMLNGATLNITGSLSDNGQIIVDSNQGNAGTTLNFGGGTVSGSGDIYLNYYGADALVTGTLTQGAGHTISGFGEVTAALTNNGLVDANYGGQTLYLATNNMVNNNIMENGGGGLLDIDGITVTQGAAGQLLANGGNVQFENASAISGGALNSSTNGGVFILSRSAGVTFNSLTNNSTVNMEGHSALNVTGALTDNGVFVVDSTQDNVSTILNFSGVTVSGSGDIYLDYYGADAQVTGTLTQGGAHTISGFGEVTAALTNNGVVNANYNGQSITLATHNMVNNNLMESSGGGVLDIDGITVTQGTNGQLLANNSNVQIENGSTISGGALNSSTNGGVFNLSRSAGVTFNSLTNNSTVNMEGHSTLNVNGALTDNGTIVVNSTQDSAWTTLNFGGVTVTGSGDIYLNYYGNEAQITGTLTQGAGHTISGWGEINAALTNNGVVNANYNGQTITLATHNMVNNNLMESSGGGFLDISGITVTQGTNGQLLAAGNNTVEFENGTTIKGGALNSLNNGGVFVLDQSATAAFNSLANNATVDLRYGSTLNVTGTLIDNGTIVVDSDQNSDATVLNFNGAAVTGTGDIGLNYSGGNAQVSGTLTQGAGHTISGWGEINAALTNNGVVNANYNGQVIYLEASNMVNNNIMESSGGGLLDIQGITVTQGTNGQLFANGGNVQLENGSTIKGGALNSSTNGGVFTLNYSAGATFNSLTNNATVNTDGHSTLNITGALTDNGAIVVNNTQNSVITTLNFSGVTVTGTGDISLNYYGADALLSGTLTQGAGHTISGWGEINAALTNNGVVNANYNGQVIYLEASNMVNNNIMESSGGGLLDISGITVTQGTNGQLLANGGNVQLENGTIVSGGALNSSTNGGVFVLSESAGAAFNSLTNNATVAMNYGSTLNVTGTLVDNGQIVVDSNQNSFSTVLNFSGGAVTGTGDIYLNYYNGDAQLSGTLTQAAGHTISGWGEINAALTNNGTVNASYNGQNIDLATNNMVNNNLMESSNGALLDIQGITITQGANGQLLANGGNVQLENGTTINGGALNSSTNGGIFILDNSAVANFNSLTNNATVNMNYASTLNITGPFTDNGTIAVDSNQNSFSTVLNFSGVTVTGTGDIYLNYYGDYAQIDGTLTQGAGHTISGWGEINAALTNNGTVNASYGGQNLYVNGLTTNNGLMEASNGGTLLFTAGVLTNLSGTTLTGGAYEANANSTINLPGFVVTNDATVILNGGGSTFAAIAPLAVNNGEFEVLGGQTFATAGNFVNSGIVVAGGSGSLITFTGTATNNGYVQATGQGTLTFGSGLLTNLSGTTLTGGIYEADAGSTINLSGSIVTNDATVILSGSGSTFTPINALAVNNGEFEILGGRTFATAGTLVNSGTLVAGGAGSLISFTSTTTNNGYMQATGGGTLSLGSGLLTNLSGTTLTGGTFEADAGSTISLTGSITTNDATVILSGAGSTFTPINTLSVNNGAFEVLGGRSFTTAGALTNYGALSVAGPGSAISVNGALDDYAPGSISITGGGGLSDSAGYLGVSASSSDTAAVSGSGSKWTSTNNLIVAYSGASTLAISGGGGVSDGSGYVGDNAGSNGTVTISGSGSKWSNTSLSYVGNSGTGTVAISGGGGVSDFDGYIGVNAGSRGFATLSGTGSKWTNTSNFIVGYSGAGTLTSSSGAALSDSNGYIGYGSGSVGTVTLSGSGTDWTNLVNLQVGDTGRGTLSISGGAVVSDFSAYFGGAAGGVGIATISGTGSLWTSANNFAVGYLAAGSLTISGGGAVSDVSGYIGYGAGSTGVVTVTGSGSQWSTSGALALGNSGTGTLIVENGALVSVGGATTIASTGTLELDGVSSFHTGSLAITGGSVVTLGAVTYSSSATLGTGGMKINTDGFNSTFSGNFTGTGGITKSGSGALTLTGANTYSGPTAINAGTLAVTTGTAHTATLGTTSISLANGAAFAPTLAASSFSNAVVAGSTASGSGGATLTLNPGSAFSMKDGRIGAFDLEQETSFTGHAFTIGGASGIAPILTFDIGNGALGTDVINVTKTVSVLATGGEVIIDAIVGDTTLTAGNYDLITSAGGFSGTAGNGLRLSGTTLAISGTTYDLSLANSTAADEILTVSDAPPGRTPALAAQNESAPLFQPASVPEPGATASLLSAFGMGTGWLLLRRRGARSTIPEI